MRSIWFAILAAGSLGCASSGGGGGSSCTPGENRCFGNSLGTCGNDGATWTLGFCGTERTCFEGQCRTQVCTPGRTTCEDEWNALVCDDGVETRPSPCDLGERCYEAGCLPEDCASGEIRCLHDTRLTCASPAPGWVAVPCPEGQACKDDQCVPKVCTPREGVCIPHPDRPGIEIGLTCNLNGTEWASQNPCSADQVCREGFCFPKTPAPPPPADTGPADGGLDPGPEPLDPGPGEDLARPDDAGPQDIGPLEDLPLPPDPNRAVINGVSVEFSDFVKASLIAGELMVALQSAPMDGVPFPDLAGRKQVLEIHFPGLAPGTTGTFHCEDDSVRLWYRFGKYEPGGECKDYDYRATQCVVTLTAFQEDAGVVSGTFDSAALEDCLPGGPPVTIVDGHFHYEK